MERNEYFSPALYSPSAQDLLDMREDLDTEDDDARWAEYLEACATVNRQHVLECVLSDLDAEDSPLYEVIDTVLGHPFREGERVRENIVVLARIGQAVLQLVAQSVDNLANLKLNGR